ncbi:hypothetical protein [Paraburkholderia tropica]|uniref:hypothetical protein n=1 Tax=Paraburkholderia tropica TaxID=92647 RepID=UPI002AB74721|nr:hypothetical protein [Paraburkholderia tropica]
MHHNDLLFISRHLSPAEVCAQLLALSVVEYSRAPGLSVVLTLNGTEGQLADTGRGMRLTPDLGDTISHAERALTGFYPCLSSNEHDNAILQELIWGDHGSLGPSLANFACPALRFTSRREGEVWSQSFRYGQPSGPAALLGATNTTGTTIDFTTETAIDATEVAALVVRLHKRIPELQITIHTR